MLRYFVPLILFFSLTASAQKNIYKEKHRPQFHFSPREHWMNDPNGLVYYKGEYHLFYQHYPDSTVWGPMHWGHAVSKDMIHWQHLPLALYPDSLGLIFSGSVVVDKNNSSGLQKGNESPLVALFTYHDMEKEKAGAIDFQYQGMAYSLDRGRTWTKYAQNPVIKNPGIKDFRDPKVFWHEPTKHWVMTLAVADHAEFYTSGNLKDWSYSGAFGKAEGNHGGVWECPDLIEMKIEGTREKKWVLVVSVGRGGPNGGSGTQYFVGHFDGKTFTNANSSEAVYWLDYGPDNYAGVTWSNTAAGKHYYIGWMSNWHYAQEVPTQNWRSAMTISRELKLKKTTKGTRLYTQPIQQLEQLRGAGKAIKLNEPVKVKEGLMEVELEFNMAGTENQQAGIKFSNSKGENLRVGYDKAQNIFFIDRTQAGDSTFSPLFKGFNSAPRLHNNNLIKLRLLLDHSSIELFADDGSVQMTAIFFPSAYFTSAELFTKGGRTQLIRDNWYPVKTIW